MARLKNGVYDDLNRLNRYLSLKYDQNLTISDVIIFLVSYYLKTENVDLEMTTTGVLDITEIDGEGIHETN